MSAIERPCIGFDDTGCPDGETTLNDHGRCRECDIEWLQSVATCEHCGRHIYNELAVSLGIIPWNHKPECPEFIERVAIVGSRDFKRPGDVVAFVDTLPKSAAVVSGGARGVDSIAEQAAKRRSMRTIVIPADWDKHGKSAGYKRNVVIVEVATRVVAFWDGESRGTKHTIDIATKAGKPVEIRR